jgi:hypothetical protein
MKCEACKARQINVNMEKCTECGHIYCWSCEGQSGLGGTECPSCGSDGTVYKNGMAGPDGESDPYPTW